MLAAWPVLVGCGSSEKSKITGTITKHTGEPLVKARVTARSDETGKWASGVTNAQGEFTLGTAKAGEGLPPGNYAVVVAEDRGDFENQRPPTISRKYSNPTTSGITLTVEAGRSSDLTLQLDAP